MSYRVLLVILFMLMSAQVKATVININFDVYLHNLSDPILKEYYFKGSFTGIDTNSDKILELSELTSFTHDYNTPFSLADVTSFGDYLINENDWLPTAKKQWGWFPTYDAWYSWNNYKSAVADVRFSVVTVQSSVVPEPSVLTLMGLGIFGLIATRRRLQK